MAEEKLRAEARLRFARIQKKASQLGLNNNDILTLGIIQQHQKPISLSGITFKTLLYGTLIAGLIGGVVYGGE